MELNSGNSDSFDPANASLVATRAVNPREIFAGKPENRLLATSETVSRNERGNRRDLLACPRKKHDFIVTTADDSESGFPRIKILQCVSTAHFYARPNALRVRFAVVQ